MTIPDEAVQAMPERIYAKTHGASTDVISGQRGLIGGWNEHKRDGQVEFVRADLALPFLQGVKVDAQGIYDYVQSYEWRGDNGDYSPNDADREMLEDAIVGYLSAIEVSPSPRAQALEEAEAALNKIVNNWGNLHHKDLMQARSAIRALSSQPVADGCKAYVGEMQTSAGTDYFVMIKSGDRELSIRKHRWKHHADYEAAEYNWVLNGGDKPDILSYLPASPGASE